jgi:hypothetical protein
LIVRDLDAHSWVEVYFNGIGWVPFDPTPAAAPAAAQSRAPGLGASRQRTRQLAGQRGGPIPVQKRLLGRATGGGGPPLLLIIAIAGATVAAAWGASVLRRRRRFLALPPGEGASVQARELDGLVRRLGFERREGVTLLNLERRLATIAGPEAGEYPRALRSTRFARDGGAPPTLRDRRDLRRALYGRGRSRRWLAGLRAIPPGGPR